jgi:hypothetical protein
MEGRSDHSTTQYDCAFTCLVSCKNYTHLCSMLTRGFVCVISNFYVSYVSSPLIPLCTCKTTHLVTQAGQYPAISSSLSYASAVGVGRNYSLFVRLFAIVQLLI